MPMPGDITLINTISIQGSGPAPIVRSNEVLGGAQNAATIVDRDAIPAYLRQEGMYVYVVATAQTFQLVGGILNANWVLVSSGASSLQAAYDGGNTILLAGALPVAITNPAASATAVLTLTQGTAGQNAITASGGNIDLAGGNFVVNTGQKVLGAAELTLDGTTVLNLQTGAAARWQVQAAPGHLVPQADNAIDIGVAATNRIRTLYAGTSVVVGATVTINGTTNTISSSANLTLDTAAAGTLNLGNTNATTIVIGNGTSAITAAGDVVVSGNLTVNGTTTTINSTNLTVTDPLIYANNGGLSPSFAGIAWDQGAALDVITVWNPTNNRIEFGRFDTVNGTTLPAGPLTTLTNIRPNDVLLAGTAVTADAALTVTATSATLTLEATGANSVALRTNGANRWSVLSTGEFAPLTDNTLDIGFVGPVGPRPRTIYAATSVVVGNTITIGSSTIASSTTLAITSANGTGGGAGSSLSVAAGAGNGAGTGGGLAITAGQGGATGNGAIATLQGGLGGATSGNGGAANVVGGTSTDGNGGGVALIGQNGLGTNRNGGNVTVLCGNATGTGTAGALSVTAGTGGTNGAGGNISLQGGTGGATNGAGGAVSVNGGTAVGAGTGGQLTMAAGVSAAGTGGEVVVQTGNAVLTTRMRVLPTGFVGVGSGTPLSTLDVQGSFGLGVASISTSTTADATATVYLVDATGGAVTLTLPTAASALRRTYHIKKTDSSLNTVTIDGAGAETIDGDATQTLIAQYESIMIVSDGTSWFVL